MDLILLAQDRIIDYLVRNVRALTREVADAMDWPLAKTESELKRLERFHKIESRPALPPGRRPGTDRIWNAID